MNKFGQKLVGDGFNLMAEDYLYVIIKISYFREYDNKEREITI